MKQGGYINVNLNLTHMKQIKTIRPYLISPILTLLAFTFFLELWQVDLALPIFSYDGGDGFFSEFEAKVIIDEGWFFTNRFIGFPQDLDQFNLYDFPLQADSFNFLIFKFFSYFTSNPFLVINCFFITGFILIPTLSFVVLRSFGISSFSAVVISVLYAFIPYHIYRNTAHLFLGNYAAIPLIVMVALWIMADKIQFIAVNQKQQFCVKPNRSFFIALAICLFASTTGIYYAFYACIIFTFAWFLRGLKEGLFFDRKSFSALVLCAIIVLVLFCLYLPSFIYWFQNGGNLSVGNRDTSESERFGLKIINLFLPIGNHYLDYFANLRWCFAEVALEQCESVSESLGLIGASGFLFLLLWLIAKAQNSRNSFFQKTIQKFSLTENDQNLISNLAGLNLITVLFATVGGFVMFMAMSFPLIRSHARFSIFIAFFSLFFLAIIFDKMLQKRKLFAQIIIPIILILALFDQVGRVSAASIQNEQIKNRFASDQDFVQRIESTMPQGTMIFMVPILNFPEGEEPYDLLAGYLHSKNLRWSYPAIMGRKSNAWQHEVMKLDFADFIAEVKKAGFSGIYIDRQVMSVKYNWQEVRKLEMRLKKMKGKMLISKNSNLVFFEI